MARKPRYPGQNSEYGGGDGTPQRFPDGESIDLPGISSAAGERARVLRTALINDFDPAASDLVGLAATGLDVSKMSAVQREAYEADLRVSAARAAKRDELMDKTNDYIAEPEQWEGEQVQ